MLDQKVRTGRARGPVQFDVSCHPSDYSPGVCPEALVESCDKHGGGMSTNPDGSHTCSGPFTGKK